jgi:DNA-dependent RNA polymerase auxiliary subunit epsilon
MVYCVFYQLENYYDDNDKTLFMIVDSEEKAIKLIEKYPQYDLCYEPWKVE